MDDAQTIFRDVINRQHIHAKLRHDEAQFNTVCAAMDILGDADVAFVEFHSRVKASEGIQYIELIGAYQAIQWTVDALRKLSSSLKVKLPHKQAIDALAEERAKIVGHPIERKEGGERYSTFIHRSEMSLKGVVARHIGSKTGLSRTTTYSPIEAIARTRDLRDKVLVEMAKEFVEIDRRERLANNSGTLAGCFHASTEWMLQHVAVAPYSTPERNGVLGASVSVLCEQLQKVITRMNELDLADVFPELIRDAEITIEMLKRVLGLAAQADAEPSIEILAFSESAVARTQDLAKQALEIDKSLADGVGAAA